MIEKSRNMSQDDILSRTMTHKYCIRSNDAGYVWQCRRCLKVEPYPMEADTSKCPGAACLCAYKQVPNVCPLHGDQEKQGGPR